MAAVRVKNKRRRDRPATEYQNPRRTPGPRTLLQAQFSHVNVEAERKKIYAVGGIIDLKTAGYVKPRRPPIIINYYHHVFS